MSRTSSGDTLNTRTAPSAARRGPVHRMGRARWGDRPHVSYRPSRKEVPRTASALRHARECAPVPHGRERPGPTAGFDMPFGGDRTRGPISGPEADERMAIRSAAGRHPRRTPRTPRGCASRVPTAFSRREIRKEHVGAAGLSLLSAATAKILVPSPRSANRVSRARTAACASLPATVAVAGLVLLVSLCPAVTRGSPRKPGRGAPCRRCGRSSLGRGHAFQVPDLDVGAVLRVRREAQEQREVVVPGVGEVFPQPIRGSSSPTPRRRCDSVRARQRWTSPEAQLELRVLVEVTRDGYSHAWLDVPFATLRHTRDRGINGSRSTTLSVRLQG